jgi:hypothetical protein
VIGGLVCIADLAGMAVATPGTTPTPDQTADYLNLAVSGVLYWFAGYVTTRETHNLMYGSLAALLAGIIDGAVVGAAAAFTGVAPDLGPQAVWLMQVWLNAGIAIFVGTLGAYVSWFSARRKP